MSTTDLLLACRAARADLQRVPAGQDARFDACWRALSVACTRLSPEEQRRVCDRLLARHPDPYGWSD